MGFLVGCFYDRRHDEIANRAIDDMASFYAALGFSKTRIQLGPQSLLGWLSKNAEQELPRIETKTGYLFGDLTLYNRQDLIAKLKRTDLDFPVRTDLAVVSQFLDAFGDAAIREVNGDFIIGRVDGRSGRLRLFRDHFGVRSLYYMAKPGITYFASAVPALLRLSDAPVEPSLRSLGAYLAFGAPMMDRTYFDEIRLLPPSACMELDSCCVPTPRYYWTPAPNRFTEGLGRSAIVPAFRDLLVDAVEARLSKTGRTGFMLSGGLDSSTVTAIACSRNPSKNFFSATSVLPVHARAIGTDEKSYVDAMAMRFSNLETYFEDGLRADPLGTPDDPFLVAGPRQDAFGYMTDSMYHEAVARGVDTMLTGYGGDIAVSGHAEPFLIESMLRGRFDLAWGEFGRLLRGGSNIAWILKWLLVAPLLPLPLLRWRSPFAGVRFINNKAISVAAFRGLKLEEISEELGLDSFVRVQRNVAGGEARELGIFLKGSGINSDAIKLRTDLKIRCPLVDITLLEAVLAIPFELKKTPSHARSLIRAAAEPFLPREILQRTDKGHFNPHFRARMLQSSERIQRAIESFRSNPTWDYLVDAQKVADAFKALSGAPVSGDVDVLVKNSIWRPYQLGTFLMPAGQQQ